MYILNIQKKKVFRNSAKLSSKDNGFIILIMSLVMWLTVLPILV